MTYIRTYQFGHRQFISPVPFTRRPMRAVIEEMERKEKERAR